MSRVNRFNTRILLFIAPGLLMFSVAAESVQAELSSSRARRALTRMAGIELTNGAVRVRSITDTSKTTADVTAELRTVFRFEQDNQGRWRAAEVRIGPDRWEDIGLLSTALNAELANEECTATDPPLRGSTAVDPSPRRARCLLGSLFGIDIPSDAIRIQEIAPIVLPLASQASATVVAWIRVDARAVNDSKSGWRISELRTGNRQWINLDQLVAAVNQVKQSKAQTDLQLIAEALEKYRGERGAYIVSDSHTALIDHLSPKYLHEVIRVDPWHHPYRYAGQRDTFTLSSTGPDGKEGTADDIARRK